MADVTDHGTEGIDLNWVTEGGASATKVSDGPVHPDAISIGGSTSGAVGVYGEPDTTPSADDFGIDLTLDWTWICAARVADLGGSGFDFFDLRQAQSGETVSRVFTLNSDGQLDDALELRWSYADNLTENLALEYLGLDYDSWIFYAATYDANGGTSGGLLTLYIFPFEGALRKASFDTGAASKDPVNISVSSAVTDYMKVGAFDGFDDISVKLQHHTWFDELLTEDNLKDLAALIVNYEPYTLVDYPFPAGVETDSGGVGTSHSINVPVNAEDDLLLLIMMHSDSSDMTTDPSDDGWTAIVTEQAISQGLLTIRYSVWAMVPGSGGYAGPVSVNTSGSAYFQSICLAYDSGDFYDSATVTDIVEAASTYPTGDSTAPNPPSITPTWGADYNGYIGVTLSRFAGTISASPSPYGAEEEISISSYDLGIAFGEIYDSPEDPGAFTLSGSGDWMAHTIAVRPPVSVPAGSWTPSDLPDLWAWWDPSDSANVTLSGSDITQIDDLSGNARHLVNQGTGGTIGSINGLDAVTSANSATNYLKCTSSPVDASEMVAVHSTSDTQWILNGSDNGKIIGICQPSSGTSAHAGAGSPTYRVDGEPTSGTTRGDLSTEWDGDHIIMAEGFDASTWSQMKLYTYGNSAYIFLGEYGEIVICDAALSTTNRQKLEGYLAHKWGMEANLDVSHPYKSSPP